MMMESDYKALPRRRNLIVFTIILPTYNNKISIYSYKTKPRNPLRVYHLSKLCEIMTLKHLN